MNEDIISVEYIDPKEWNKKLVELNNGERARYYEHAYAVEKIPTMPHLTGVPKKFEWEDTSKKVYYTVTFKPSTISISSHNSTNVRLGDWGSPDFKVTQGFKVTIKTACSLLKSGDDRDYEAATVVEKLKNDGHDINSYYDLIPKITPLSKDNKEQKISEQVLKDKYGVQIELGDWVAHPSGTYGGGSSVTISQVNTFGLGTVNGWKPVRLIVVRSDNKNKKLGWGGVN